MDPILVVNAGSSSVKFQVFAIEGSSELTLQIKGQVDGIGTQPRLRARAPGGIEVVDQRFERGELPDVPAALETAGAWLRQRYDIMPIAVGHRVVHGGPRLRPADPGRRRRPQEPRAIRSARAAASAQQSGADPLAARAPSRTCRKSRASTPPFIAVTMRLPITMHCRSICMRTAFVVTVSTACRMNTLLIACPKSRRRSRAGASSLPIWAAARRCARWQTDAASRARSGLRRSTDCRWERGRASSTPAWCCF